MMFPQIEQQTGWLGSMVSLMCIEMDGQTNWMAAGRCIEYLGKLEGIVAKACTGNNKHGLQSTGMH